MSSPREPSKITPGRIATALAGLAGIATAVAPVVADMDWTSTAGVIAGGLAVVYAIGEWLKGWRSYEHDAREAGLIVAAEVEPPPPRGAVR